MSTNTVEQEQANMQRIFFAFCEEHSFVPNQTNFDFVVDYCQNIWKQPMTRENLEAAFPYVQPHLVGYEPHQKQYIELVSTLSEAEKKEYHAWQCPTLKPTYKNAIIILSWLRDHGFPVTKSNLNLACGQQRVQGLLEFLPSRGQRDPRSHTGSSKEWLEGANKTPRDYARERAEAAAKTNPTAPTKQPNQWQRVASSLLGTCRSHAQNNSLQRLYDKGTTGMDWREVARQMQIAKNAFSGLISTAKF